VVSGGIRGCLGRVLCQNRLKLSLKADECKPLPGGCDPLPPLPKSSWRALLGMVGRCRLTLSNPR